MILTIGSNTVYFPFEEIYPEQIQIMFILQKLWKEKGNGVIGIPAGIDLPPVIMSFFFSFNLDNDYKIRLLYITELISETEKLLRKFKNFFTKKTKNYFSNKKFKFLTSCFMEKAKLCINSDFKNEFKKEEVEDFCLSLILPDKTKKGSNFKIDSKVKKLPGNNQICSYYENFLKKKFKKKPGLWTTKNIRKEAFLKRVCPFFLSHEIFFESYVNVLNFEQFFSPGIFKKDLKNIFKTSFLVFDNSKNIDTIFTKLAISQLNSSILNDSTRGLLYVKKFFFSSSSIKELSTKTGNVAKKLINSYKGNLFFFGNKTHVFSKYVDFNFHKNKNLTFESSITFFDIFKKIINWFHLILRETPDIDLSIDQFFNSLFNRLKKFHFNSEFLIRAGDYLIGISLKALVLNYRYFNGLKYLIWFLKKLGIFLDSNNENFRVIRIKDTTIKNLKIESFLFLCCFELSIFTRLIFENTLSFLFFSTQSSFLFSNLCVFNQNSIYYGNVKPIFKKSFVSNQKLLFKESIFLSSSGDCLKEISFLIKKIISLLIKISQSSSNGIICTFSSHTILLEVLKVLNNSDIFKQLKKIRNIFIESLSLELNLKIIEEYKISCDLGLKSIFFGLSNGIISKLNVENFYSRLILNVQTKQEYLNKFKRILFYQQKFYSDHNIFSNLIKNEKSLSDNFIFRKSIGSKKDYGIFLNFKQIGELEKNYNEFNHEIIKYQEMIKDEKLDISSKIDQFFSDYSNYNIGI